MTFLNKDEAQRFGEVVVGDYEQIMKIKNNALSQADPLVRGAFAAIRNLSQIWATYCVKGCGLEVGLERVYEGMTQNALNVGVLWVFAHEAELFELADALGNRFYEITGSHE